MKRTTLCTAIIVLSTTQPLSARSLIDFDTPYHLRAIGQGFLTTQSEGSAFINGMLPIAGDENRMFFVDGLFMQGRSREQVSSLALGLRQRRGTSIGDALIGAYVAGDYLKTLKRQNAWIINPGLEILTVKQEARLNVYTPIGGRKKSYGNTMASALPQDVVDDAGVAGNDLTRAFGNNFLDTPVALLEEIPLGAEIELGQKITHGMWLRAGGYYFTYKSAKSTEGVQANIDIPLQTHGAHLLFMDSYDNRRHNLFSVGVRFDVGDTGDNRDGILSRMTDPLRRHLASVQVGSSVPVRLGYEANGPAQILENVAFFAPGGNNPAPFAGLTDFGVCTAENPCALSQDNIDAFEARNANNSYYFFAKGTYTTNNQVITFNGGENGSSQVWGFDSSSFNHQAQSDDRPLINGALFWGTNVGNAAPNSSGTVRNMRVRNDSLTSVEGAQLNSNITRYIATGSTGDLTISNSDIYASAVGTDAGDVNGDNLVSSVFSLGQIVAIDSTVIARASGATSRIFGDAIRSNSGSIRVYDSEVTITAGDSGGNIYIEAIEGFASSVIIESSSLIASIEKTDKNNLARSRGIYTRVRGSTHVKNSDIYSSVSNADNGFSYGIDNRSGDRIQVENSLIQTQTSNSRFGSTTGVFSNSGDTQVSDSLIEVAATDNTNTNSATGIDGGFANGTLSMTNSIITASGDAQISSIATRVTPLTNTGNICRVNGDLVTCD